MINIEVYPGRHFVFAATVWRENPHRPAPGVGVVGHKGHDLFTERQHNGAKDGLGTATGIDTVSRQ